MNRRQAKRLVAAQLGDYAFLLGKQPRSDLDTYDLVRFRECAFEFAEELYRRAGLDREARQVDERQLSIYDALEGV